MDTMFDVPGSGVSKVTFTKEAVAGEKKPDYVLPTLKETTSPEVSQTDGRKTADNAV